MGVAREFTAEIIKARPQWVTSPSLGPPVVGEVVDLMSPRVRLLRDDLGSINRALERDLGSFKTGDVSLKLLNSDAFFDDLFDGFGPTDVWGMRLGRRGGDLFSGCIFGAGSVVFDRRERTVGILVYGLNKLLDTTDGSNVRRFVNDTTFTSYASLTLTVDSTSGWLSGDVVHITDHVNSEDATIKLVTGATTAVLEAALVHTYASGSAVSLKTPYYRYKTVSWLAQQLFTEAGFALSDLRLGVREFSKLGPTPVNLSGLGDLTKEGRRGFAQVGGQAAVTLHGDATYFQSAPDAAWVKEGGAANTHGFYDWSKYFIDGAAEPGTPLRDPQIDGGESGPAPVSYTGPTKIGIDYASGPFTLYCPRQSNLANQNTIVKYTTSDGISWAGPTGVSPFIASWNAASASCEFDVTRGYIFISYVEAVGGTCRLKFWDGSTLQDAKPAGDPATTGYFGPVWVPELDAILCLKGPENGPAWSICAFRGATLLWERPFPNAYVVASVANTNFYPTRTIRYINGSMYCIFVNDGAVQFLRTDDEFQSFTMRQLFPATSTNRMLAAKVNGMYAIAAFIGSVPRGYAVAAPFYAGVVNYADFSGISGAEALKRVGVLANAFPWLDDSGGGHMVSRDLYDPGAVVDVGDRVSEREDTLIWQDVSQYVSVRGNGFSVVSGNKAFASQGFEISSDFLPNEAFAQEFADSVKQYYSARRRHSRVKLVDRDGRIYYPLDRVTIDGTRWFVYESDHDVLSDVHDVQLLEDI